MIYLACLGSFLATPDELIDNRTTDEPTEFTWAVKIMVNDVLVHQTICNPEFSLYDLIAIASAKSPVSQGELIAWPAFDKPSLEHTELGRFLVPTDKISIEIESIGILIARII